MKKLAIRGFAVMLCICIMSVSAYGAQMLVAITAVAEMGYELNAFQIIPNLFYPMALLLSSLVFIFLIPEKGTTKAK